MSDDYEEVEEFEDEAEEEATEEEPAAEESAAGASSGAGSSAGAGKSKAAREEVTDEHTIAARQAARDEMARQIEEFLARGGRIQEIEPEVTADPPRKPGNDYGGRSI